MKARKLCGKLQIMFFIFEICKNHHILRNLSNYKLTHYLYIENKILVKNKKFWKKIFFPKNFTIIFLKFLTKVFFFLQSKILQKNCQHSPQ